MKLVPSSLSKVIIKLSMLISPYPYFLLEGNFYLFYKDETSKMEVADPTNGSPNNGLKTQGKFTAGSAIVEMGGPIFCDVFSGERLE